MTVDPLSAAIASTVARAIVEPECIDALAERLIPRIAEALKAEFDRRELDRVLDSAALATYIGKPTVHALTMFLSRSGGAELASLAIDIGGRRGWRRSDVDAWLRSRSR